MSESSSSTIYISWNSRLETSTGELDTSLVLMSLCQPLDLGWVLLSISGSYAEVVSYRTNQKNAEILRSQITSNDSLLLLKDRAITIIRKKKNTISCRQFSMCNYQLSCCRFEIIINANINFVFEEKERVMRSMMIEKCLKC